MSDKEYPKPKIIEYGELMEGKIIKRICIYRDDDHAAVIGVLCEDGAIFRAFTSYDHREEECELLVAKSFMSDFHEYTKEELEAFGFISHAEYNQLVKKGFEEKRNAKEKAEYDEYLRLKDKYEERNNDKLHSVSLKNILADDPSMDQDIGDAIKEEPGRDI